MKSIKKQLHYVPLRRRFLVYLSNSSIREFTTKEARDWYERETGANIIPYSNLYVVLLKPLLIEGYIGRVGKGLWVITIPEEAFAKHVDKLQLDQLSSNMETDSEWEAYIRSKMYTPDQHRGLGDKTKKEEIENG